MKKIISILAILVLILSLSACKRAAETEDEEVILDKETEESNTEETEQGENNQTDEPEAQEPTVDDTTDDTIEESLQTEQQAHDPALDRVFSPYEVIVVLTEEETAKKLTYTPEDFPEVDSYYVQDVTGYFYSTNPEYSELTALTILLNEATKQNVLDSIKILEGDPRIHAAHTNSAPINNIIALYTRDFPNSIYDKESFSNYALENVIINNNYVVLTSLIEDGKITDYNRYDTVYKNIKIAHQDNRIESIKIQYIKRESSFKDTILIKMKDEYSNKLNGLTVNDFSYLNLDKVTIHPVYVSINNEYRTENGLALKFSDPSVNDFYEYISLLEKDERVDIAHVDIVVETAND